jgi:hypothetical protein
MEAQVTGYSLDSLCGPPRVKRAPEPKPLLTGIEKVEAEQAEAKKFWDAFKEAADANTTD